MNEELINLLREIRPNYGDVGSRDVNVAARQKQIDRAIELLSASKPAALEEYTYETYTGQCGWLVVSKEEYEQSEYRKRRTPIAASPERAAFEAWAKKKNMDLTPFETTFDSDFTSNAWDGWSARAALQAAPAAEVLTATATPSDDTRDAARYRWLVKNCFDWAAPGDGDSFDHIELHFEHEFLNRDDDSVGTAIDAEVFRESPVTHQPAAGINDDGLIPRPDLECDPLWQWRCIANEAEIIVNHKGKFMMLSEEMCVRLGSALEDMDQSAAASDTAELAHLDDWWVDLFAKEMKDKLAKAREKGRGGWQDCAPEALSNMLREHVEKGDPRDVANFCMFLWAIRSPISATPQPAADAPGMAEPVANAGFSEYRLKVAEECNERLMSACTDAGCPDGVNMADWIRDLAKTTTQPVEQTRALTVTPAMVKAAMPWLTSLHHMRKTDKESNIEEAIKAALTAAYPASGGDKC